MPEELKEILAKLAGSVGASEDSLMEKLSNMAREANIKHIVDAISDEVIKDVHDFSRGKNISQSEIEELIVAGAVIKTYKIMENVMNKMLHQMCDDDDGDDDDDDDDDECECECCHCSPEEPSPDDDGVFAAINALKDILSKKG